MWDVSYHQEISSVAHLQAQASTHYQQEVFSGTPLVSDPGSRLVKAAIAHDIQVFPIPGPSAVLSALAVSGLSPQPFTFCGFLPPKSAARIAALEKVKGCPGPL